MASISIVSPIDALEANEQANVSLNGCSPTTLQTDVETRLAHAAARREYDVTVRTHERTIEHIRQLIQLECTRVDHVGGAA